MQLKSLYLKNFRNYIEAEVLFGPNLNVIWGDNAQGKTNLLEAILLIATGRSFRTQHLGELIRETETYFYLEAHLVKEGVKQIVRLSFDGRQKKLQIDNNTFSSYAPLLGTLPCVISAPFDTDLITGPPSARRRLLNFHLAQSDPLYMYHLARFWKAMKQRNFLLKTRSLNGIECWEAEMALSASYLIQSRKGLIQEIEPLLKEQSQRLSKEGEIASIRFHTNHPIETEKYLAQLVKNRERELKLGATLTGPHRDDLSFWIGGKQSQTFASEGQKKTAIASLRLAEWQRLSQRVGANPLFAIDDFAWPLDASRQGFLLRHLETLGQVFLTAPCELTSEQSVNLQVENGLVKNCI